MLGREAAGRRGTAPGIVLGSRRECSLGRLHTCLLFGAGDKDLGL